jgi:hypothetical protein
MKATCPTSKEHKEFLAVATVTEEWKVNSEGVFIEVTESLDTVDIGTLWTCAICGEHARVED